MTTKRFSRTTRLVLWIASLTMAAAAWAEDLRPALAERPPAVTRDGLPGVAQGLPGTGQTAGAGTAPTKSGDLPLALFDLPSGATIVIQLDAQIAATLAAGTTQVCNQVTVSSTVGDFPALMSGDPDAMIAGDPDDATCTPLDVQADLAIAKADSVDPVVAGNNLSYTLDVTNAGPFGASTVTVTDTLPAGVTFVSAVGTGWACGEAAGVVTCTRAVLEVGAAPSITVVIAVPASASGSLTNSASVAAAEADPAAGNNSAVETTAVTQQADLSITKGDSPDPVVAGGALTYTLAVANAGPSDDPATVTVVDTLPAGVTFVSAAGTGWTCGEAAGVVTCTRAGLAVGAAPAITIMVTVDAATTGTLTNNASVSSPTTDPNGGNDSSSAMTTVNVEADLAVTKVDDPDPVVAGNALTYTVSVSNLGASDDAATVTVVDTLPAGVTFVSAVGTGWTCGEAAGVVTCTRAGLAVGAAPDITIAVTVDGTTVGMITNTVTVSSPTTDPNGGNDMASAETTVEPDADLAIAKADADDPPIGGTLIYTLSVTNNGPSEATAVEVVDTLPAGVTFASAVGTGWACGEAAGVVTCTRPTLAVGAAPDITLTVTVDPAPPAMITNTATVSSATADSVPGNNSDSEDTTLDAEPPTVSGVLLRDVALDPDCATTVLGPADTLSVSFSEDVVLADDAGSYLLVGAGATPDIETSAAACGPVDADDETIAVTVLGDGPQGATLSATAGILTSQRYRLLVCDAIEDNAGNALDGDGDGDAGGIFAIDFRVDRFNHFGNGHFDCGLDGWTPSMPVEFAWSGVGDPADDAGGASQSGSARLDLPAETFNALISACVPLATSMPQDLRSRVKLSADPGDTVDYLQACELFATFDCTGASLGPPLGVGLILLDTGGVFNALDTQVAPPPGSRSARCSFSIENPEAVPYAISLDHLFFGNESLIFADGFESGDTSAWALSAGSAPEPQP